MGTEAVRFLVLWMAGWIHSRQLEVIDFLREENRVLREQLGGGACGSPMTSATPGSQGQDRRSSPARRVRWSGHARHDPALVPRADRSQVRRLGAPAVVGSTMRSTVSALIAQCCATSSLRTRWLMFRPFATRRGKLPIDAWMRTVASTHRVRIARRGDGPRVISARANRTARP